MAVTIIALLATSALLLVAFKIPKRLWHRDFVPVANVTTAGCVADAPNAGLNHSKPHSRAISFAYPVGTSNRRFVDQYGGVYLLKAMSSWALTQRCSNAAITNALEGLKSLGFNAVTVAPFGVHLNPSFGDRYTNESAQKFFEGEPFASAFGPAWTSMDWVVEEATRLQMTAVLSLFLSFEDTGTSRDLISAELINSYEFGKALALRYVSYPNIIWHVMGDFEWTSRDPIGQRIDAVFHGIRDGEGPMHRLVLAEPTNGLTGYRQFISAEGREGGYQWFKQSANTLYDYGGNSVELFDVVYREVGGEIYSVVDIEPPYVNSPHYRGNQDQQYRERNYSVFIRGGSGINYGHEKWWPFGAAGIFDGGAGWLELLDEAPQRQVKFAWSLIDRYIANQFWIPDDGRFVKLGVGDGDTKTASGFSRVAALAYFPTARDTAVDTTVVAGSAGVKLSWYDPTRGTFTTIAEFEAGNAYRWVTFPEARRDGSTDWILIAERI